MRLVLLALVLVSVGCVDTCNTLGYDATVDTTADVDAIRAAFLAEGWTERESEGPRRVFDLDDRHRATVAALEDGRHRVAFFHVTEEDVRALATPVAGRLGAEVAVAEQRHCGAV